MLSIQEMLSKTKPQRDMIERSMDDKGTYHPEDANLYMNQKRSIQRDISETLRHVPLREFLIKSGTQDVAGAAYLVPDKLHTILINAAQQFDLAPLLSMDVVTGWEGGDLDVDIAAHDSLRGKEAGGGGEAPSETVYTAQATISPKLFSYNIAATNEMVDDSQWDLIEWHTQQAGKAMGYRSTELCLPVLKSGADGDGTVNSGTSATTDTTVWTEILAAVDGVAMDEFIADTLLITPEAWEDTAGLGAAVGSAADTYWKPTPHVAAPQPAAGFRFNVQGLDTVFSGSPQLHDAADAAGAAFTTCVAVIFDRKNALLTGRKRWLQIENYADPIRDLAGAVVSSRQDSVSIYNDSIYVLTEKT